MALHLKNLEKQTVIITGATSGIGLATARMAAEHGARLVLAARDENTLRKLCDEINLAGGEAVHVAVDVGDKAQVQRITQTAIDTFGGFDTWINNAGVSLFGNLLDVDEEDCRRLFDTTYWGVVYGSLEAARHLGKRRDGYAGAIINLGSIASDQAMPYQGMYSAAKHAVKGFTDALRMELEHVGAPISVTLIKPATIATPFPEHAGNVMDTEPTLPPPLYEPRIVARSILYCSEHPRRDMYVGGGGRLMAALGHCAPRLMDKIMSAKIVGLQKTDKPEHRRHFALQEPATDMRERAPYSRHVAKTSLYTNASMHPVLTTTVLAGALIGFVALTGRRSKN
ncbi:SDR family oxidoreductase [Vreelandella populi]|uniref:SDR family NAD(P)-dependent oxidoreductase n=1 Tax=Vreelandella populi TaxID=2498858 RepID=A0A433LA11_9GAMM|nr:SDR family oxidoreductase [Halomonas populi]RUR36494.1 SDR family NAD(P)-dependent oxidoreductase [Halomonas populi]RUR44954.1 SDR family NAD(P)-dependent oxidoreductase [Halomonas populi]RUR51288.1 SDR family NAD(P)-dependent oxidoreductase [Halomonas populi]